MKALEVLTSILSRGGAAVLALISNILIARLLGPTAQGEYFLAITFSATVVQFGHFGLHSSNSYFAASKPASAPPLFMNNLWISVLGGSVIAAVSIAVTSRLGGFSDMSSPCVLLAGLLVPLRLLYLLTSNLQLATGHVRLYNGAQIVCGALTVIGIGLVAPFKREVLPFLGVTTVAWLLTDLILLYLSRQLFGTDWAFRKDLFKEGLGFASKAYLLCILSFLVTRGVAYPLQVISGPNEVGLYSVASQCNDALALIPTTIATILFPSLVRDPVSRARQTRKSIFLLSLFMTITCGTMAVLAKPVISLVLGEQYSAVVPIIYWSLPGVLFYSMISILSQYLAAIGFPKMLLAVWLAGVLTLAALSIVLIPKLGGRGAAIAVSSSFFLVFVLSLGMAIFKTAPASGTDVPGNIQEVAPGA